MVTSWNIAIILGTIGLLVVNLGLFKRLIVSDFFSKSRPKKEDAANVENEEDIMLNQGM